MTSFQACSYVYNSGAKASPSCTSSLVRLLRLWMTSTVASALLCTSASSALARVVSESWLSLPELAAWEEASEAQSSAPDSHATAGHRKACQKRERISAWC